MSYLVIIREASSHRRQEQTEPTARCYQERDPLERTVLNGMSLSNPSSWSSRNSSERRQKECKIRGEGRADSGHQESKALGINEARLIWTHRDWSNKHRRAYTGLPQVLYDCITAFSLVSSWNSWACGWVGLWFLCLLLGSFASVGLLCPVSM